MEKVGSEGDINCRAQAFHPFISVIPLELIVLFQDNVVSATFHDTG